MPLSKLPAVQAKLRAAAADAAEEMARGAAEESQELVPVVTGKLKRTMRIRRGSGPNEWTVTYGEGGVRYAAVAHNRPPQRYPSGGISQFLRQPLMDARARLVDAADAFRKVFR